MVVILLFLERVRLMVWELFELTCHKSLTRQNGEWFMNKETGLSQLDDDVQLRLPFESNKLENLLWRRMI